MPTPNPICVIAGDIHYSRTTLDLADYGTRMAILKANELNVPFVSNGDLHNDKANLRAECVNALIETFKLCKIKPYLNVGNHSRLNEKSPEHALNFLAPYGHIIEKPVFINDLNSYIIPYDHDVANLTKYLKTIPDNSRLIMHQGVESGNLGDYIQDKSALPKSCLANFRTILSHYHARQDIICGRLKDNNVGLASYIGNLYSLTYGEASDPAKGYQILYDDGSLKFVPTNLRTHRKAKLGVDKRGLFDRDPLYHTPGPDDLVWVTVEGPSEYLAHVTKETVAKYLDLRQSFKLDLVPLDTNSETTSKVDLTDEELVDSVIDGLSNTSDECKIRLKNLWRNLGG